MSDGLFNGRVALLSGVGPGLGAEAATVFAREGARIVLTARNEDRLVECAGLLRSGGAEVIVVASDITDPDSCATVVARAVEEFGRIDTLVNIAFKQAAWVSLTEASETLSEWRPAFDVNFFGTMTITRAVAVQMVAQKSGSIVMVNSIASEGTMPAIADYTGSKAALAAAARTLALELGPHGIRVNSIHPGTMWGPYNQDRFESDAHAEGIEMEDVHARAAASTPLRYLPGSEEIAEVLAFFASDRARAITGQQLHVNVGQHFH